MIITNSTIATLKPCDDRHRNYLQHYKDQDLSVDDFIDSVNLSYADKIWVCRRLMTATQARSFAILCAESVLHLFEATYPNNPAPRNLINYLKSIPDLGNLTDEQNSAIVPLRKECYDATVTATVTAAAISAAAAHAAAHAAAAATVTATVTAYAAAYTNAAAYAADAAADADADADAAARKQQQNLNLKYLKMAFSL